MRARYLSACITVAMATLALLPTPAVADDAVVPAPQPPDTAWARPARNEMVGLELSPVATSFNAFGPEMSTGFGVMLRILRRRWMNTYWTPVTTGLFAGKGNHGWGGVIQVLTEGGLAWRTPVLTVETGLGLGVGLVATAGPGVCDGTCSAGGSGMIASPVVRAIFRDLKAVSLGISARAELPLSSPSRGDSAGPWGYLVTYGSMVLVGVDVGFGSP